MNFKRLAPSDPDYIWATFDVEFNSGNRQSDVELLQVGDDFRISQINASVNTTAQITQKALGLALKTEPK
jgi:hypothetical protein